ncbi:MAG: helix-turn-helix transcriptional regulator [Tannerellaceae bacterium]|nr:helix-turn-helix transcriptional regulator [Tannerellaceae bacterium]
MKLKVAEICKEKGITLKDLASRLGITNVGLSQQLNGNPTMATLIKIATALEVHICDLFDTYEKKPPINGYIEFDRKIYKIDSIGSLEKLLERIKEK